MRAMMTRPGRPPVFTLIERAAPLPGPGMVRVRVAASGLNPLDARTAAGDLKLLFGCRPRVLGVDIAGVVDAVGAGVDDALVGTPVMAMMDAAPRPKWHGFVTPGGHAELAITRADTVAPIPQDLSMAQAASLPLASLTALQALRSAGVSAGHEVLIIGAGGGVGRYAVQLAVARGARVTAVCSQRDIDRVSSWGAAEIIDRHRAPLEGLASRYDVVYDVSARTPLAIGVRLTRSRTGRFISNLFSPRLFLARALGRRVDFAWVRSSSRDLGEVAQLIEADAVRVDVDRIFSLEECAAAHAHLSAHGGRVVLMTGVSVDETVAAREASRLESTKK